ncbi:MAG: muramoyltetrapeptide carboxypeptidase [Flavobacteriaceae bacterium]|jgi:muramoyltetrapeptide carboxypeptidase
MNRMPMPLVPGDLIALVAPAKSIDKETITNARAFFEDAGFRVLVTSNCLGEYHYFSGTIGERLSDFQSVIDNPEVKAIVCARGGYGCIQLIDRIQWAAQRDEPKWIVGFSDVTILHQRMQVHGIKSIHGTMPLNFDSNSASSLETLVAALKGKGTDISVKSNLMNAKGVGAGTLLGGNLSILFSALGTEDQVDYTNSILFIEDVGEHLYHIDRMFYAFEKSDVLEKINGLIVGGMTGLKDTATPFGKSYQEIILSHFKYRSIPIVFDFPAGHIDDNRALILGADVNLTVNSTESTLSYTSN